MANTHHRVPLQDVLIGNASNITVGILLSNTFAVHVRYESDTNRDGCEIDTSDLIRGQKELP